MPETTSEVWLPIAGYEDLYEVSSLGRVRSLDRTVLHRKSGRVRLKGRVLVAVPSAPYWYLKVMLSRDGVERSVYVHQLVAVAFHGPRPVGMEVRHGPGGRQDNRASSLCWGTPVENQRDKRRDGTQHMVNRVVCPRGHPLAAPNLHAATARKGGRACLACNRAQSYVRHAWNRKGVRLDLQVVADKYYEAIVADAAA